MRVIKKIQKVINLEETTLNYGNNKIITKRAKNPLDNIKTKISLTDLLRVISVLLAFTSLQKT